MIEGVGYISNEYSYTDSAGYASTIFSFNPSQLQMLLDAGTIPDVKVIAYVDEEKRKAAHDDDESLPSVKPSEGPNPIDNKRNKRNN